MGAKLRINERKAKLVWAFPSESNFDGVKVTKNRAKSKRKTRLSVAIPRWSNFDRVKVTKKNTGEHFATASCVPGYKYCLT